MRFPIFTLLMLATLAFSSCQKGDAVKDDIVKDDIVKDGDKVDCPELVYPVSYVMPDGVVITGNETEINLAMKAWYEAHPGSKAKPVLQYPVQLIFGDLLKTINNEGEMELAKKGCDGGEDELKVCDWDGSKVSDSAVWEKYVIEPLVTSDTCGNCIVSGIVKYVKINSDFAYAVYYGKGECDEWAYLVTYYGGSDKKEYKCKFKLDCDAGN